MTHEEYYDAVFRGSRNHWIDLVRRTARTRTSDLYLSLIPECQILSVEDNGEYVVRHHELPMIAHEDDDIPLYEAVFADGTFAGWIPDYD